MLAAWRVMAVMLMVVVRVIVMTVMFVVVMLFLVMAVMRMVVVPFVLVMMVIMPVAGLATLGGHLRRLRRSVIMILRYVMGSSGVNIEFYAGDPSAGLALEMQVAIAEIQF